MYLKKSPCGSYFPYPYKGGELFRIHLGNFDADEDGAICRMKSEETFFVQQDRTMGVWVDFYQTKLTVRIIGQFIEMLEHIRCHVPKLGLVGCSFLAQRRIIRFIRKTRDLSKLPVKFFDNPEDAKTWLVSECL